MDWATLDEGIAGLESYLQALRLDPALNQGDGDRSHEIEMAVVSLQLGHCYQCRYEYIKAKEQYVRTFVALKDIIADAATSSSSQTVAAIHLALATFRWAEINRLLGGDVDFSLAMLHRSCLEVPQEDFATPQYYAHMLVEARGAVAVAEAAEVLDTILHQDPPQDIAERPSDLAMSQTNYRSAAIMAGQFAALRGDLEAASRYFTMEWAFVLAKGPLKDYFNLHHVYLLWHFAHLPAAVAAKLGESTDAEDFEPGVGPSFPAALREHHIQCAAAGEWVPASTFVHGSGHGCMLTVPAWVSSSWVLVEDAGLQCSRSLFMDTHEMLHLGMDAAAAAAAAVEGGLVLEFGVQHGRTLKYITARFPGSRIDAFDTFTGFPEEWGWNNPVGSYSAQGALPSGQ